MHLMHLFGITHQYLNLTQTAELPAFNATQLKLLVMADILEELHHRHAAPTAQCQICGFNFIYKTSLLFC